MTATADNMKMEMRAMRNFLRQQNKLIRNDPFCRDFAPYLSARIVSWSRRGMLVCVHDRRAPLTNYNSFGCRWHYCQTYNQRDKYAILESINKICHAMRKYGKN